VLIFGVIYLLIYSIPILFFYKSSIFCNAVRNPRFWFIILIAFLLLGFSQNINFFSWKYSAYNWPTYFQRRLNSSYNSNLIYFMIMIILGIIIGGGKYKLYGMFNFKIEFKVYFYFLLFMIPLIILACTQKDFLDYYPNLRLEKVSYNSYLKYFLRYEPFYLLEFVGLEWFFRGFMVLALATFIDKRAVILIACVYCAFHFGKPMGECISSFFGGYILGYMAYKTKSIWGGIMVHMGIALLMDVFAMLANKYLY
jgi:membrane protease YdiL (CAAX protease family)